MPDYTSDRGAAEREAHGLPAFPEGTVQVLHLAAALQVSWTSLCLQGALSGRVLMWWQGVRCCVCGASDSGSWQGLGLQLDDVAGGTRCLFPWGCNRFSNCS